MLISRVLSVLACLMGAAGVAAAAAAAHGGGDARMGAAAQMLLVHAAASLAMLARQPSHALLAATAGLQAGALLFAADMASRALAEQSLFPMAAPSGGILLIAAWLAAGVSIAAVRR